MPDFFMLTQTSTTDLMRQEGGKKAARILSAADIKVVHRCVLNSLMGITSSSVFSMGNQARLAASLVIRVIF